MSRCRREAGSACVIRGSELCSLMGVQESASDEVGTDRIVHAFKLASG